MSVEAMSWALSEAPVEDRVTLLVLLGLANHARKDGTASRPSRRTLAGYARCSTDTVDRRLQALQESGLVRRGDQRLVEHLPRDRRPVVYDLDLTKVRADPVVQALAPSGRGPGPQPSAAPVGAQQGAPGPQMGAAPVDGTGPQDPGTGAAAVRHGTVSEPSLTPHAGAGAYASPGAREGKGGGGKRSSEENQAASGALEEVLRSLPVEVTRKVADGYRRQCMVVMAQLLVRGWRPHHVITEVQASFAGAGNVGAVLKARLTALLERPAPASAPWLTPANPAPRAAPPATSAAEYVAAKRAQDEQDRVDHVPVPPEVLAAMRRRGARVPAVAQDARDEERPRAGERLPEEASA